MTDLQMLRDPNVIHSLVCRVCGRHLDKHDPDERRQCVKKVVDICQ